MKLEGLTDNEKDARIAELEAKLAEAEARAEEAESSREQAYYALAYIQREGPRITDISAEWPEVRMSVPGGFVTGHDLVQCVERAAEIDAAREGSDADTGGAVRSQARQEGEGRIMKAHLKKSTVLKACEAILGEKTYHAMETVRAPVPSLLNMAAMNAFLQDLRTAHASTVRLALLELNQEGFIEYEPEDLGL
jgi:multidrug resistance efflux pump